VDFGSDCRSEFFDVSVRAFVVSDPWDLHSDLAEEIRECRDGFCLLESSELSRASPTGSFGCFLVSTAHLNSSKEVM